jgi:hypothetical protein
MKIFLLAASIAFAVLTFVGIGLVFFGHLYSEGAGLSIVSMVFGVGYINAYRRKYRTTT